MIKLITLIHFIILVASIAFAIHYGAIPALAILSLLVESVSAILLQVLYAIHHNKDFYFILACITAFASITSISVLITYYN